MKKPRTTAEALKHKKYKAPNGALYRVLMWVTAILNKKVNANFTYKARPADEKGPIVMIANHASRVDFQFTAPACYPKKLNYVVGYNEFFRFPVSLMLRLCNVIPKKNFTPDMTAILGILRVNKAGGNICFMPEGMSSITGMGQPVIPGGGELLKHLGCPVYYSKISGGYMTYTKHCLDERKGRVDVTVDRMFTAEELKELTPTEIEDRMNRLLAHDDYMWNKEARVKFNGKGRMAKNLETLLYWCPKCGATYRHVTEGNTMRCTACGNTVEIDEYYDIRAVGKDSFCPPLVTDWTIAERAIAAEEVQKPDFSVSDHVKIGFLPERGRLFGSATSKIRGDGTLTLNREGLHFLGKKDGEPFRFDIPSSALLSFGMCTDITRLYTFLNGEFIEFYFDSKQVLRWDHLAEELHRANGGKWQNTEYRHEP